MMELLGWLSSNWEVLVGTLVAIVGGATAIVRAIAPLTSTRRDDDAVTWLDKVFKWLSKIAVNPPVIPATKAEAKELAAKAKEAAKPAE